LLAPIFDGCAAVVGMSATLSPPEFYRDLLGFSPGRTTHVRVPSPFPRARRLVRVEPRIDTRYTARQESSKGIAGLISGFSKACPGNVLALFPSYRFLDEVHRLIPHLGARRIIRPSNKSTELERDSVFRTLSDGGPPVLLLTVSGGPFAEGVDYPGRMLLGVVVVSPGLPQVRFEQERLKEYFANRFEKGFEYAYVIPGMTRVVQSAGRLIRTETDFGMILLVCKRFLQKPYVRYIPADWFEEGPAELQSVSILEEAKAFFDRMTGTDGAGLKPVN
jgi:DNA excision repair protein ERCC-2